MSADRETAALQRILDAVLTDAGLVVPMIGAPDAPEQTPTTSGRFGDRARAGVPGSRVARFAEVPHWAQVAHGDAVAAFLEDRAQTQRPAVSPATVSR